jgi:hypothetical protein
MRFMIACAAAALLSTALPVDTARAAQVPPAATAPSERQMELTRRYLNLLMTDQFEEVIHQMLGAEFDSDAQMQAVPDEDRRFILGLTTELTTDMIPQMIAEMVPVYAAVFTEEELVALVGFYDSPLGRSIAEKSVQVMPEAERAVMALVPQMLEKMALRMCQHYGCTPAELQELRQGMREGSGLNQSATRK